MTKRFKKGTRVEFLCETSHSIGGKPGYAGASRETDIVALPGVVVKHTTAGYVTVSLENGEHWMAGKTTVCYANELREATR